MNLIFANQNGSIRTSIAKNQIKFELSLCTKQLIPKVMWSKLFLSYPSMSIPSRVRVSIIASE